MSSFPSRSPLAPGTESQTLAPIREILVREVLPFPFAEVPRGATKDLGAQNLGAQNRINQEQASQIPSGQNQDVREAAERETRARALGREEAQAETRKVFEEQLAKERANLAEALAQFANDRAVYYQKVEAEVVQLALSIARKILHREAEVDPLLLAGIVRVAVEKIESATAVTLRIHPCNADDWRRYFAMHLNPTAVPEIVEDPSIAPDRCILETAMGVAELGMEVQMKEIEKGLMDLLAARPEKMP
jgi:flagellar assembly protein FliH